MPTWRQGQAVGEWRQIPNSALSSVPITVKTYPTLGNTGPSSKVDAWSGYAFDTRDSTLYSAAAGGHSDYAGNEVDRIRLSDNAPTWTEVLPSTPPSQINDSATHNADGRPASRHTCYGAAVNEVRDRVMVVGGSRWGNGFELPTMDGYSITGNRWDAARTYPDPLQIFGNQNCNATIEDKSNGDIYVFAQWTVMRWSNSTNKWTAMVSNSPIWGYMAATALDTKRQRILVAAGGNNEHHIYDLATNTVKSITFGGSNAGIASSGEGNGLVYDANLDAYLFRRPGAGATVYRIDPQTFAVEPLSTTGGSSIPSARNGVLKRFYFAPQLKGVVFGPSYNGNLWFLRTN
jgi:hypothetical protein